MPLPEPITPDEAIRSGRVAEFRETIKGEPFSLSESEFILSVKEDGNIVVVEGIMLEDAVSGVKRWEHITFKRCKLRLYNATMFAHCTFVECVLTTSSHENTVVFFPMQLG